MSSYAGFQEQANFVITFEVMVAIPLAGFVIVFLVQTVRRVINSQAPQILFQICRRCAVYYRAFEIHMQIPL